MGGRTLYAKGINGLCLLLPVCLFNRTPSLENVLKVSFLLDPLSEFGQVSISHTEQS